MLQFSFGEMEGVKGSAHKNLIGSFYTKKLATLKIVHS